MPTQQKPVPWHVPPGGQGAHWPPQQVPLHVWQGVPGWPHAPSLVPGAQVPSAAQQPVGQMVALHGAAVVVVLVVVLVVDVVVDVVVVVGAGVVVGTAVVVVVVVGAVQRRAAPGPLSAQTSPAQQTWLPSQGWPAPRQAGAAPTARRPAPASTAPARAPPSPLSTPRREAPPASRLVNSSNVVGSMAPSFLARRGGG